MKLFKPVEMFHFGGDEVSALTSSLFIHYKLYNSQMYNKMILGKNVLRMFIFLVKDPPELLEYLNGDD